MSGERIRLGRIAEPVRRGVAPTYAESGHSEIINQGCVYQSGLQLGKVKFQDNAVPLPEKARIKYRDILVNSTGTSTLGRVGFVDFEPDNLFADGHVSILRITDPRALAKYVFYSMYDMQHYFENALAKGATNQIELSPKAIADVEIPVPPLPEQRAIVRYLDAKLAQIDQFVANKRRLIELLQEQKQVIVNRYVTRGLDDTAELKDSGLEWVGKIPSHWEILPIKRIFQEIDRRSEDGEEPLLSLRMYAGLVTHSSVSEIEHPPEKLIGYKKILPGEMVMNRMRAAIGLFAAATQEGLVSPDYALFVPDNRVDVRYFELVFKIPSLGSIFRMESRGLGDGTAGFLRLYTDRFGRIRVFLPPLAEQRAIVARIKAETAAIARAVAHAEREIELIGEYRTTLISEAVTGKIDVRGWEGE